MASRLKYLVLLAVMAGLPGMAPAQSLTEDQALRKALATRFELPEDSPLIDQTIEQIRRPVPRRTESPERPIVKHLRGTTGKPFTPVEELEKNRAKRRDENLQFMAKIQAEPEYQAALKEVRRQREEQKKIKPAAPALPSCERDVTITALLEDPTRTSPIHPSERVVEDILFIKAPVPMDPDLAFGKKTRVIQYSTKPGDYLSVVAASEGIKCLPYRIRITQKHSIHDMGLNALKNYDENPKGSLYEGVKARLHAYR